MKIDTQISILAGLLTVMLVLAVIVGIVRVDFAPEVRAALLGGGIIGLITQGVGFIHITYRRR